MSIISDILDVFETRLLTVADVNDVILPSRKGGDAIADKTIVVQAFDIVRAEEHDHQGNPPALGYRMPVEVSCVVIPSENADPPEYFDEVASDFGIAAQKAITSVANWHTFGGNSFNADLGAIRFAKPTDETPGSAKFRILVFYRTSETDPNVVRS